MSSKKNRDNITQRNDDQMIFAEELRSKGHTCVFYIESYPVKIGWCEHEVCKYAK